MVGGKICVVRVKSYTCVYVGSPANLIAADTAINKKGSE